MRCVICSRHAKASGCNERDNWLVVQEQLNTERNERASRYYNLFSTVRRLVLASTSGEDRSEELVYELQLLYEDSRKILVSSGPSSHVVGVDLHVHELKLQVAMKKIERVVALAVAASSKRGSNVLRVRNTELDSRMTRLYSKAKLVKRLRGGGGGVGGGS